MARVSPNPNPNNGANAGAGDPDKCHRSRIEQPKISPDNGWRPFPKANLDPGDDEDKCHWFKHKNN